LKIDKLLAGTLAIFLVAGLVTPAYASLIGDTIHFKGTRGVFCEGDVVVVDPGVETKCSNFFLDLDGDSISFESTQIFGDGIAVAGATYEFTDLDWINNPGGKIIGVELVSTQTIPHTLESDDHSITLATDPWVTDCGDDSSCLLEWRLDIEIFHPPVGGEFLPIDSTALLLAGLQSSAIWMLPVLAGAAGVGFAAFKLRRK